MLVAIATLRGASAMDDSSLPPLSFALMEARIEAMPEGPSADLDTPRWAMALNLIGAGGAIVGLIPSVLVHVMQPQLWMVTMAYSGMTVMAAACVVPFVRSVWVLGRQFVRGRAGFIEQMDHDREAVGELTRWLSRYPKSVVADHLRFAQHAQATLQAKVGLLVGGFDKLGILPAVGTAAIVVKGAVEGSARPAWLAVVGIFLALLWAVGLLAGFTRMRVQSFETLLSNAAKLQNGERASVR